MTTRKPKKADGKRSMDWLTKQLALDAAIEQARLKLKLETLDTRRSDSLDFHELAVWTIRDLVRNAFEAGYHEGLHTGYRQGRSDACKEAAREKAPIKPRNPELIVP